MKNYKGVGSSRTLTEASARMCTSRWAGAQSGQYSPTRSRCWPRHSIFWGRLTTCASLAPMLLELTTSSFMFDKFMSLPEAVEGYALFSEMRAQKVIFRP